MSRVCIWHQVGYDLVATVHEPYNFLALQRAAQIEARPIRLESGGTIEPGSTVAYLGSDKSSAGFDMLYPVEPGVFRYLGVIATLDDTFAVWQAERDGKPMPYRQKGYEVIHYAHSLVDMGGFDMLLYRNHTGAGRVIETVHFHPTHDEIPPKRRMAKESAMPEKACC